MSVFRSVLRQVFFLSGMLFLSMSTVAQTEIPIPEVKEADKVLTKNPGIIVFDSGLVEILAAFGLDKNILLMPQDLSFEHQYPKAERYTTSLNIESLMLLKPDIILGGNPVRDRTMMEQAHMVGLKAFMIDRTLPTHEKVRLMAELFGVPEQGEALIKTMMKSYQKAETIMASIKPPKVLHISNSGSGGGTITVAGEATPAHTLITAAGGYNVAGTGFFDRYQSVSTEGLLSLAPEVVVVSDQEIEALDGKEGIWKAIPGLAATPAGLHHSLIILPHKGLKNGSVSKATTVVELAEALKQVAG